MRFAVAFLLLLLVPVPGLAWWNESWRYRVEVNLTGQFPDEYIVGINLTRNSHISPDFRDVRFVYADSELRFWKAAYTDTWAYFYVKIPNSGVRKIYIYYGNPDAADASDPLSTFRYTVPRTVAMVVSERLASTGVRVMSLVDNNTVCVGSSCAVLNAFQTRTFSGLTQGTEIKVTGPAQVDGFNDSAVDAVSPMSSAGTEFAYRVARGTNRWSICSPFGQASVRIYDSSTVIYSASISGCTAVTADVTDGNSVVIVSDLPILVQHVSTERYDSRIFYPVSTHLVGIGSTNFEISTGTSGGRVGWIRSDGASSVFSFKPFSNTIEGRLGSFGSGPAYLVVSSVPVGADQLADSDGVETTTFLPITELGTLFGAGNPAGYIAVAAPYPSTTCRLYTAAGEIAFQTGGTSEINKLCFGCGSTTTYISEPWILSCDKPVFAYYENDAFDTDETNLLSFPQFRQFVYPEPVLSFGPEEPLSPVVVVREQPSGTSPGKEVTVRFVLYNSGPRNATGIFLSDFYGSWIPSGVCCGGIDNGTHVTWNIGTMAPEETRTVWYSLTPRSAGPSTFSFTYNGTDGVRSWSLTESSAASASSGAFFDTEIDLDATTPEIERTVPVGVPRIGRITVKNVGDSEVNSTHPLTYRWVFRSDLWVVRPDENSPCVTISINSSYSALQCQINSLPPGAEFSARFSIEARTRGYEVTGSESSWDPPLIVKTILRLLGIL